MFNCDTEFKILTVSGWAFGQYNRDVDFPFGDLAFLGH